MRAGVSVLSPPKGPAARAGPRPTRPALRPARAPAPPAERARGGGWGRACAPGLGTRDSGVRRPGIGKLRSRGHRRSTAWELVGGDRAPKGRLRPAAGRSAARAVGGDCCRPKLARNTAGSRPPAHPRRHSGSQARPRLPRSLTRPPLWPSPRPASRP